MARPLTDERWKQWAFDELGINDRLKAPALTRILEMKGSDAPSERTVRRWIAEWHELGADRRLQYQLVYWPETFERNALPWEAVADTFVLWRVMGQRPTVRLAKWWWRVGLSLPGIPMNVVFELAGLMASYEVGVFDDQALREVEESVAKGIADMKLAEGGADAEALAAEFDVALLDAERVERVMKYQRWGQGHGTA